MTDINSVTMTGNLTKDVEIRNGVARISIAVNRSVKDPNTGNWNDVPSYFDWVRFLNQNTNIENLQQQLVKGTPVTLMGEARQNRWQDQGGNNQYSINFVVNNWKIHARKQPVAAPPQQNYGSYQDGGYQGVPQAPAGPQGYPNQGYQQSHGYQGPSAPQQPPRSPDYGKGPESFDDSDIPF